MLKGAKSVAGMMAITAMLSLTNISLVHAHGSGWGGSNRSWPAGGGWHGGWGFYWGGPAFGWGWPFYAPPAYYNPPPMYYYPPPVYSYPPSYYYPPMAPPNGYYQTTPPR
ncbi:MAG TPA: hypothetical protein VLT37_03470 [Acidocella sp.]|nr:hypothetical protein [Acidocella sp.]